jgi:hypothetical protein
MFCAVIHPSQPCFRVRLVGSGSRAIGVTEDDAAQMHDVMLFAFEQLLAKHM